MATTADPQRKFGERASNPSRLSRMACWWCRALGSFLPSTDSERTNYLLPIKFDRRTSAEHADISLPLRGRSRAYAAAPPLVPSAQSRISVQPSLGPQCPQARGHDTTSPMLKLRCGLPGFLR